jgi:hypothetical protein
MAIRLARFGLLKLDCVCREGIGWRRPCHADRWREAVRKAEMRACAGVKVSKQRQNTTCFAPDRLWSHSSNPSRQNIWHRSECAWPSENRLPAPRMTLCVTLNLWWIAITSIQQYIHELILFRQCQPWCFSLTSRHNSRCYMKCQTDPTLVLTIYLLHTAVDSLNACCRSRGAVLKDIRLWKSPWIPPKFWLFAWFFNQSNQFSQRSIIYSTCSSFESGFGISQKSAQRDSYQFDAERMFLNWICPISMKPEITTDHHLTFKWKWQLFR